MTRLSRVISRLTRRHHSAYVRHDINDTPPPSPFSACPESTSGEEPTRRSSGSPEAPQMEACLGTFDLVSLGVGSCLGTGIYLTAGIVASTQAGPGGVVSFLVAGVASMLTGLCYAELSGHCPKSSGSAYMYAYVTAGELAAFVIGWGLVVEYVIGTAAGACALSETLDSMCNGVFSAYLKRAAEIVGLPKLDLLAAVLCAALTLLLASGVEMSVKVNNLLNLCNLVVLVLFVIVSLFLGSLDNWRTRGFFPMGVSGVVHAIPTCYFAFIGFDALAATGAEARNPARAIPLSILLSILLSAVAYATIILTLTFDLPFYLLPPHTAMTDVFPLVDFTPGKYVVAVGAVTGEFAATFGSLFPLPRVLMTMASDGLIFRQLGHICPKRHTPVTATLCSGLVAMVMATFFRLAILIELVLIGTLLAYILVTFALLHMRYVVHEPPSCLDKLFPNTASSEESLDTLRERSPQSKTARFTEDVLASPRNPPCENSTGDGISDDFSKRSNISYQHEMREARFSRQRSQLQTSDGGSFFNRNLRSKKQPAMSRRASLSFRREEEKSSMFYKSSSSREQSENGEDFDSFEETRDRYQSIDDSDKSSQLDQTSVFGGKSFLSKLFSFPWKRTETRTYEAHPLLETSAENDFAESEEDILFEKRSITDSPPQTINQSKSAAQKSRTVQSDDSSGIHHPRSRKFAGDNHSRSRTKSNSLLRMKFVVDIVNNISASAFRVQALLYAIYGVEIVMCVFVSYTWRSMADGSYISLGILGALSAILGVLVGVLTFLPESVKGNSFRAPLVPSLPLFVALMNIFLMTSLSAVTWLLFALWMSAGLLVYVLYGILHNDKSTSTSVSSPITSPVTILLDDNVDDDDDDDGDDEHDNAEEEGDENIKLLTS